MELVQKIVLAAAVDLVLMMLSRAESSVCVVDEDAMSRVGLQYHIADGYDLISDDTKPSCLVTPTEKLEKYRSSYWELTTSLRL